MMELLQTLVFLVFPAGMVFAAISDLMTMTISNRLNAALLVAFVVLAPLAGLDLQDFAVHVAAAAGVLALAFFCFAMGWIGGGDAKFAAVAVLWLGWPDSVSFVALASIFGGALTISMLAFRRAVLPGFVIRQPWIQRLHDPESGVPYGVALAAAGLAVYPDTGWMALAVAWQFPAVF